MPEQNLSITGRNLIAFNEKTQAFYLLEGKCSNLKDINTICLNYRDKLISLETGNFDDSNKMYSFLFYSA